MKNVLRSLVHLDGVPTVCNLYKFFIIKKFSSMTRSFTLSAHEEEFCFVKIIKYATRVTQERMGKKTILQTKFIIFISHDARN